MLGMFLVLQSYEVTRTTICIRSATFEKDWRFPSVPALDAPGARTLEELACGAFDSEQTGSPTRSVAFGWLADAQHSPGPTSRDLNSGDVM